MKRAKQLVGMQMAAQTTRALKKMRNVHIL